MDVAEWLRGIELEQYGPVFRDHDATKNRPGNWSLAQNEQRRKVATKCNSGASQATLRPKTGELAYMRSFAAGRLNLLSYRAPITKYRAWLAVAIAVLAIALALEVRSTLYHSVHFTDRSLDNLRTAILSAAGAMLSAMALSFTLTIFLTQRLGDYLHYTAFQQIAVHRRFLRYFAIIFFLAVLQYWLGAILNQKNALAVCVLAMVNLLFFAIALINAFVETGALSDPEQIMKRRLTQTEQDIAEFRIGFVRRVENMKPANEEFSRAEISDLVHSAVDAQLSIISRTGLLVDECTPLIQRYQERYDYRMVKTLLENIRYICSKCVTELDDVADLFEHKIRHEFGSHLSMGNVFTKIDGITRSSQRNHAPTSRLVISAYKDILLSSLGPNSDVTPARAENAYLMTFHMQKIAAEDRDNSLDLMAHCLREYTDFEDKVSFQPSLLTRGIQKRISDIIGIGIDQNNGGFIISYGVECLVAILKNIFRANPKEWHRIGQVLDTFSAITREIADKRQQRPLEEIYYKSFDGFIAHHVDGFLWAVDDVPWVKPEVENYSVNAIPALTNLLEKYVSTIMSVGELLSRTGLIRHHDGKIADAILHCIRTFQIRRYIRYNEENVANLELVDQFMHKRLLSLSTDLESVGALSERASQHLSIRAGLAYIGLDAAQNRNPALLHDAIASCMEIARDTLRTGSAESAEDVIGYIYAAVVLSSLDAKGDSLTYIAEQLKSGLWADYTAKCGNQEIIRKLLSLDERGFREDDSIYILSSDSKNQVLNLTSADRLMSAQRSIQQVIESV